MHAHNHTTTQSMHTHNTIHAHTTQFSNSAIHARTQHNSFTHTTQLMYTPTTQHNQGNVKLAGDLASWNAKVKVLRDEGIETMPKGKSGNTITRMYARTGWWPLKRESESWTKAIDQFGVHDDTTSSPNVSNSTAPLTKELGPRVRIRQVVLDAFRGSFLAKAEDMKKEYESKGQRRKSSVPGTVFGRGFCKDEDLRVVKANDERLEQKAEKKVLTHAHIIHGTYTHA